MCSIFAFVLVRAIFLLFFILYCRVVFVVKSLFSQVRGVVLPNRYKSATFDCDILGGMTDRNFSYDPSRMRTELSKLLREASFAASIGTSESIRSLTRLESDMAIWEKDLEVMDSLFTYASITRVGLGRSLLTPLARMLSRREMREVIASLKPATKTATVKRMAHIASLAPSSTLGERAFLDHQTSHADWPKVNDRDLTPLEIALGNSPDYAVSLSAYQWEAVAIIETVRAAGRVVGKRDADTLANQFQLMILAYGGTETAHIDDNSGLQSVRLGRLVTDDSLLRGGFIQAALEGTVFDLEPFSRLDTLVGPSGRGWWPLSGPDQMLAVTILAAWIRMSRLGVRLSSFDTLESWRWFFDGRSYGSNPRLVGQGWLLPLTEAWKVAKRYRFFPYWNERREPSWLAERGGTPLVFVGIAAKLLDEAVRSLSVLDKIPDGFDFPNDDSAESVEGFRRIDNNPGPDRKLLELRRLRDRIISFPIGSAYELALVDKY
ncbi:hypothetical protein SEA_C3PO_6 [Corynebacterium phage C3PO]|uniref:Uncharacterized protein n=2 Tax=Corynebacterium virus C3PO TaxID=2560393 RepID=A0A3G3LW40_9CAUD|nr:hypothetical protein FDJ10_gp06 [Corynebacterium phage C3PO]ATW58509.1 hypothetical protein SEA_C3PO_6 [Corynebacterium phage C3PO]AYQ98306.1 hypothetical protein CRUELLA_6 [Corynebacterium phage Cruella]